MTAKGSSRRFGLSCALATPFISDGGLATEVNTELLAAHAKSRLSAGCSSVTLFGTTGEGASLGEPARERTLAALKGHGIDMAAHVVVGIAASAAQDAIAQAKQAAVFGCRTALLAPPFYFKGVGDEGLQRWFSIVLEGLQQLGQQAILYHIPSVTSVPLSHELIGQLKTRHLGVVIGVKDSSGDWSYAQKLLAMHKDLVILIGDERRLAEAVRLGAEGAISGLANFAPELLLPLVESGRDDVRVSQMVDEILRYPVVPAVKEMCAHLSGNDAWRAVSAPLEPLSRGQATRLCASFDVLMSGVPA
jgi:4-hydroxy-tetrahydrodipicolinate synthase